jgi:hypothetical protein
MSTKPLLLNVRSRDVNDIQQQRYIGTELNRPISACLFFISLPMLWAVFTQRISLCGMPVGLDPGKKQKARLQSYSFIPAG